MIPAMQKEEIRIGPKKQMLLTLLMGFDGRLISGRLDHKQLYLAPQSGGTRAEVATILMRFLIN